MSKPHTGPARPADRLHLLPRHREMLLALLREHLPGMEVWAYGSRVNGQSHDGSDLDLVLRSPDLQEIPIGRVGDFREALQESNIPFLVEARDWARLPEGFHREIERGYVVLAHSISSRKTPANWLYHPLFPDHWDRISLYSMAQWVNGLAYRNIEFSTTGRPIIKIAEIKGGISGQTKFTHQNFDESVRVRAGDLLFSWSGQPETSIDASWWRGPEGWLNQHIFRVTPSDGIDTGFFFYLLRYLNPNFVAIARNKQTTGLGHVTKQDLENIEAALPDHEEQRAIAHILGTLDDKIELNRRMNETLESMSRALFKSWFVDFDPVHAKAALKHHAANRIPRQGDSTRATKATPSDHSPLEGESARQGRQPAVEPVRGNQTPLPLLKGSDWTAERAQAYLAGMEPEITALFPDSFAASELGPIPAGWAVKPLGALIELAYGKALKADQRQTGSVPVYGSNGRIGWHDQPFIQGPNIIVGRKGNPGTVTWAAGACFPIDTTFYVVPKDTPQSLPFLFYALEGQGLPSVAADSAVPGLNRNLAYLNKQVTPPTPLVARFGEHVQSLFTRRHGLEEESRTLASLRDTLLPKLVSGELRIDAPQGFSTEFHDG